MPVDYHKIGDRIRTIRFSRDISQGRLAENTDLSRENNNRFENATQKIGIEALVSIANALHVSVEDLLLDSLDHPISTVDSELHRLMLGCNKLEEEILTRNAQELKKILCSLDL